MEDLRIEKEIISKWKEDIEKPLVSIMCTTYNHEHYIEDALNSFLKQKTTFPFEIIIYDDASTDATPKIIKEYVKNYPKLIKPIYQTENQFSKGIRMGGVLYKIAKGNYRALCEGDDYWTDEYKLQIQVDEMKRYPLCNISFHYATIKYEDHSQENGVFCKHANENKFFNTKEVIKYGGPLMPTASICVTKRFTDIIVNNYDKEFFKKDIMAFYMQVLASVDGGARYINKNMCVYRRMGKGSWTETTSKNYRHNIYWVKKSINSLEKVNKLTNYKFNNELMKLQNKYYMKLMYNKLIPEKRRNVFYRKFKSKLFLSNLLLLHIIYKNNLIYKLLSNIKRVFQ